MQTFLLSAAVVVLATLGAQPQEDDGARPPRGDRALVLIDQTGRGRRDLPYRPGGPAFSGGRCRRRRHAPASPPALRPLCAVLEQYGPSGR